MSSGGEGIILAVPAALVVGPVAAVAVGAVVVVGLGVGICYMAGRGLIAGTQAVQRRCQEHAANRRACEAMRRAAYQRSRQALPAARATRVGAGRQAAADNLGRLRAIAAWLDEPLGQPEPVRLPSLDEAMRVHWPKTGEVRVVDVLDSEDQRDQLNARRKAAIRHLSEYAPGGVWEGLFPVASIEAALESVRQELDQGRLNFATERLRAVEQRLSLMQREASDCWRARAAALRQLAAAATGIDTLAETGNPELVTQVEAMAEMLQTAEASYHQLDFVSAEATAAVIARHIETALTDAQQWRRQLYLAEAQALREEIAAHGQFDQRPEFDGLLATIENDLKDPTLSADGMEQIEAALERANRWADNILKQIETVDAAATARQITALHCAAQLESMGYVVDWSHPVERPPLLEEKWRLVGRRPAPDDAARTQHFIIDLGADGGVWFDVTQGYKDKECDELKAFITGLQDRGFQGFWSPSYNAEQTAEVLRQMFEAEGYYFFEERSDEGLVYTLVKGDQLTSGIKIPWNGQLPATVAQLLPADHTVDMQRENEELEALRSEQRQRLHY